MLLPPSQLDKNLPSAPKVVVVGAGSWGKNLIRTFSELQVLAAICDRNPKILDTYENSYVGIWKTPDYQEIISDASIDAVVIATPPSSHYALAKEALIYKKHVFVEKPLALNVPDGEELVELAHMAKKTLMVGHILHYHSAVLKLKELIDVGQLGKIRYIYANRLNMGKIRTEENILWSFAPHDISLILMCLGEFPESIHASGGSYLQRGIFDTTLTTLDFPSGVKAHIFVSWLHPFKEHKFIVVGDEKMAVFDDLSKEKLCLYSHRVTWIERTPVVSKAEAEEIPLVSEEPLLNEARHFLECIQQERSPRTDGKEGLGVLRVLDLSQKSLNSGKTVTTDPSNNVPQNCFVHESSYVDEGVAIGEGTQIWHFSHLLKGSKVGKACRIGQNVVIGPNVTVGNRCKIQNNVSVYEGVILEDEVFCGPSMVFTNVTHPRSAIPRMKEHQKTLVKRGATIGANATILCGLTIGKYAFIGAGAVVTKDVRDYALIYGNPAEQKGWMCVCGKKIEFRGSPETFCLHCERVYQFEDERVTLKPASSKAETLP